MDSNVNVKVAVRCRPMSRKEMDRGCSNIVQVVDNVLTIKGADGNYEDKTFTFDHVYDGNSTQVQVYQDLGRPVVNQALEGFNGTIFAYGQTGSGKTFSMMGTDENKGIIPLLNDELWVRVGERIAASEKEKKVNSSDKVTTQFFVTVSFLEVYNEDIKDLLNPSDKKLKIHESPDLGIYVEGLCELVVKDAADVIRLIYQGNAVRHVGATQMNDQSSRSHSVFIIKIEQRVCTLSETRQREQLIKAKLNLVDLAGSERVSKTNATGQTLKEGANINKSLMTLGNVINQLSEGLRKGKVIPYRESKLTRLLQESLGGNSATVMIASISPADYNYSETVSTLKYANRAKSIENAVTRNEDSSVRIIKDLQDQIATLKAQLENAKQGGDTANNPELEAKLKEMELSQMNAWEEREKLSKQLEMERQQNVNNVISQMMQNVKEQKVLHMKNIKRLTNEKAVISKNYKELKDTNTTIKQRLDESIAQYQDLQAKYDASANALAERMKTETDPVVLEQLKAEEKENEVLANQMYSLLIKIEQDRVVYSEKRDAITRLKKRLEKIEVEITEERAELVATAGVLQQNDKIREQIKEEERLKMQEQFEQELNAARLKLEEERLVVRETIHSELEGEMEKLRSEIKMLKSLLKIEESKNVEWSDRCHQLTDYSEQLEQKLADSEVAQETLQEELDRVKQELENKNNENKILHEENHSLQDEIVKVNQEMQESIEQSRQLQTKLVEDAKFDMFKKLMDSFNEERKLLEMKYSATQSLLAQATKDLMHVSKRNQELEVELQKVIFYEPAIT